MSRIRTHYDNLKVSRDAPIEVIRALSNLSQPSTIQTYIPAATKPPKSCG